MIGATSPPPPGVEEDDAEPLGPEWRTPKSWHRRAQERLRGNYSLVIGLGLVVAYVVVAVAALLQYGVGVGALPVGGAYANSLSPPGPSRAHPFGIMGTVGWDVLAALVQATPIDLALLGSSIGLTVFFGLLLGAYAGFVGGPVDVAVTFASDLLATVPPFFLVMVLFLGLQPFLTAGSFLVVFGLLYAVVLWPYHARPVRAQAQQIAGEPYVEAARAAGARNGRLLRRHVIPNAMFPLLAQVPIDVYNFLFVLTVFPFLGCFSGSLFQTLTPLPSTHYAEWGLLLATGVCYGWSPAAAINHWWMYAFPAATVIVFGIGVALLCDGAERFLAGIRPAR